MISGGGDTCSQNNTENYMSTMPLPYPPANSDTKVAPLAQSAEHLTLNQAVEGSIPSRRIVLGGCWNLVDRIDLGSIGVTPREGSSPSSPIYTDTLFYNQN